MAIKSKRRRLDRNYAEQCQEIIHKYINAGNEWPAPMRRVAAWACRLNLFTRRPPSIVELCAHDLSRAARQEYITDEQGRRVRRFHAFRRGVEIGEDYVQTTFWTDIQSGRPEDMQLALQQRRLGIVGDCKQLKTDADSYNDNNPHGAEIQMSFNFEEDLADLAMPVEYNPGPPPEADAAQGN